MKKTIFLFTLLVFFAGCYSTIYQVEKRWGPPAKIEQLEDKDVYYYHFYKGRARAITYKNVAIAHGAEGWVTVEITTDKKGTIISKRQYWKQP